MVEDYLPAIALLLAWATFRLNRSSARSAALSSAQALLQGVKEGMIRGPEGPGWGELYFSTVYTPEVVASRAKETEDQINAGTFDQVFVVPPEPLRKLATSSSGAITERTVAAANTALWRVEVFNQLVLGQTLFNARNAVELRDQSTSAERVGAIASAAAEQSAIVHAVGIGAANAPKGWYRELKDAVDANIDGLDGRLTARQKYLDEPVFIVLDAAVIAVAVAAAAAA